MIKMIVTDLDETLLKTDKTISQYTIDIIKKVRNQGIKFIFATARGSSTRNLIPYELFDGYVLMNGAKAYIDNRLIYDKTIPANIFIPFLQNLSDNGLKVAAEINDMHYANFNVKEKWNYIDNFIITDYRGVAGSADKLYGIIESPYQIDLINSILPDELYLNFSRDSLAMIMHKEGKKINGVLEIARKFNISKNYIIAFGDDINDREMLLNCGVSVAMGNSIEDIKDITDYICDINDNDGVAKWLEENILG
ncbi:HAD family hydrolase [Irregularibacter muris]|uniref:HAD family hydrolase n=1 Tax=Irregularibacter muris TaxID=1796619 RepID=A0AAE3L4L4_9FIRM|nr:HAD family hydrolase [Irregularibacter muris]MCR1900243.1 HAD family hydrolase [Irregularibacter muris]